MIEPLHVRLSDPGLDTIDWWGIKSVSFKAEGELSVEAEGVLLRWRETRTTEQVGLEGTGTNVETLEQEYLSLRYEVISAVWVTGGWWWPRLDIRVFDKAELEGIPGTRGVSILMRVARRDRAHARAVANAIRARLGGSGPDRSG